MNDLLLGCGRTDELWIYAPVLSASTHASERKLACDLMVLVPLGVRVRVDVWS